MAFCLVTAEGRGLVLHTRMRFVVHEDARVKHVARWQRGFVYCDAYKDWASRPIVVEIAAAAIRSPSYDESMK